MLKNFSVTSAPQPRFHHQLDSSPLFPSTNQHRQIQLATYCLPYIKLPKTPNQYILTLKMVTAMFAETDKFHSSTRLSSESRSCTLNSSCENLITRITLKYVEIYEFFLSVQYSSYKTKG
jgi:hypothetical protein